MRKEVCHSDKGNKKGLSALVILLNYLGIITNAAVTVITLIILFSISSQPIARRIVTAARASIIPDPVYPVPLIGHSLLFECSQFQQTLSRRELSHILGTDNQA